jgi:hypothetical protein
MWTTILTVVQVIFILFDVVLFCSSVIGNSVVIYVLVTKEVKNKAKCLILSVAMADLQIGLFGIPMFIWRVSFSGVKWDEKRVFV